MSMDNPSKFLTDECIRKLENGDYKIASLLFKVNQLCLYGADGEEIKLNYQQALLLKMFMEADDHFLNKEQTINELWPEAKKAICRTAYYNSFNMCVKRLRDALCADKNIELLCKTKKGYVLMVKNKLC